MSDVIQFAGKEWPQDVEEIIVSRDKSVFDLSPLANLPNLRTLWVAETNISDLTPLATCRNLERLDISGTQVVDLSPLSGLEHLDTLYMRRDKDIPDPMDRPLEKLGVGGINPVDLRPLENIKTLEFLDIDQVPVDDHSPLSKLQKLRWLKVDRQEHSGRERVVNYLQKYKKSRQLRSSATTTVNRMIEYIHKHKGNGMFWLTLIMTTAAIVTLILGV